MTEPTASPPESTLVFSHGDLAAVLEQHSSGTAAIIPAGTNRTCTGIQLLARARQSLTSGLAPLEDLPSILVEYRTEGGGPKGEADTRFAGTSPRGILRISGQGRASRVTAILRSSDGQVQSAGLLVVAPGMPTWPPIRSEPSAGSSSPRWSRVASALGGHNLHHLQSSSFALLGCGRTGSLMGLNLAKLGVNSVALLDPDVLELHNLDSGDAGTEGSVGRPKVEVLAEAMRRVWPRMDINTRYTSVSALESLGSIKESDFLISCVDDDGARWAAGVAASLYLKPLLDIGSGVFAGGRNREMGADVRLLIPGEACVQCFGGMARRDHVTGLRRSYADEVRQRVQRDFQTDRAGSLRSLNQIAAGIAMRLAEDFYAGRVRGSLWVRVTFDEQGIPSTRTYTPEMGGHCPICLIRGQGDQGLPIIGDLPGPTEEG